MKTFEREAATWKIRYFEQRDVRQIMVLEAMQDEKWLRLSERDLQQELRLGIAGPAKVCLVAQAVETKSIDGYLLFSWQAKKTHDEKDELIIARCLIHPDERYEVVEKMLLGSIRMRCLNANGTSWYHCRETDLGQQILLYNLGFRAICVKRGFFVDTGEDAYVFKF